MLFYTRVPLEVFTPINKFTKQFGLSFIYDAAQNDLPVEICSTTSFFSLKKVEILSLCKSIPTLNFTFS